jgi:acetolactate synthase I/II/III large subunit
MPHPAPDLPATTPAAATGADRLLEAAAAGGVQVCFANPGTTEMPVVAALDRQPALRAILCLFEGVCTGAADGYGRMTGRPALTLLHLGPGFANGIANLHNARRARSPIVNLIGDHATWHRECGAPLATDIASLARPVSDWYREAAAPGTLEADMAEAVACAAGLPGRIATLVAAHDHLASPAPGDVVPALPPRALDPVPDSTVRRVAEALRASRAPALLLGDTASDLPGLQAAARIAARTGARLIVETFSRRLERGAGRPAVLRMPYFPEQALALMDRFDTVVLAGAPDPVSFFGYPGLPSRMIPEGKRVEVLAAPGDRIPEALEALASSLGPGEDHRLPPPEPRPGRPHGPLTAETLAQAIAAVQPEGAIITDESVTSGGAYFAAAASAPPHSYLNVTGGAIGWGLPCATGAAVACPDRPVIALEADGSGMYTLQALWTQAHEGLNVTTVICSNRSYRILGVELRRAGIEIGPQAQAMMDLSRPPLDWVRLAAGMGVPGELVTSAEDLATALERAVREPGPCLIEALLL